MSAHSSVLISIHTNQLFSSCVQQEENEIPTSVFVKDPPPFPRDDILEEGEESAPGEVAGNCAQEGGLKTIDLSSDEDVGLEAELEEEEVWPQDLENMEKSRAEKLKRSSLKKVRQVFSQTDSVRQRLLTSPLSAGGQSEEGIFTSEHWEEDDKDRNKDCFSGATREDQTENFQLEGFTTDIQHQEGTSLQSWCSSNIPKYNHKATSSFS